MYVDKKSIASFWKLFLSVAYTLLDYYLSNRLGFKCSTKGT